MKYYILILVLLAAAACSPSSRTLTTSPDTQVGIKTESAPQETLLDEKAYLPLHYELHLDLSEQEKSFSAVLKIKVKALDSSVPLKLFMDPGIKLDQVSVNDVDRKDYTRVADVFTLQNSWAPASEFVITLSYSVSQPRAGMYFYRPSDKTLQAWTKGEPNEARAWLPGFDSPKFKAPFDLYITGPDSWKILSNGTLVEIQPSSNGKITYHWKETIPLPTYLYSILAGDFTIINDGAATYWVPPAEIPAVKQGFRLVNSVVDYFSQLLIPYPFEKLAIGVAYDFLGAMEHASSITYSQMNQSPRDGYDIRTAAHEIAHQWFGDTVTCKTWDHLWLNEGFANYFEVLYWQKEMGQDEFLYRIEAYKSRYMAADTKDGGNGLGGPLVNFKNLATQKFGVISYEKGALVLNTLRYTLGDAKFFAGLKHYLEKFKFKSVDSDDLRLALEESSGENLKTFFDQWVYRAGQPELNYSWSWDEASKLVTVSIKQAQPDAIGLYETPLDIYVNGRTERVFLNAAKENAFSFPSELAPRFVALDPNHSVLSLVKGTQTPDQWMNQLQYGPTILSRGDALASLGKTLHREDLVKLIDEDKGDYLKYFIYKNLQSFDLTAVDLHDFIAEGLNSSSDHVRMVAADLAGKTKSADFEDKLIAIFLNDSYSYASMYAAFSLGALKSPKAGDVFLKELYREPRRNYALLSAVIGNIGERKDSRAGQRLMELFDGPFAAAHFMRAITSQALAQMKFTEATKKIAEELIIETQPGLDLSYIRALVEMNDKAAIPYLQKIAADSSRSSSVKTAALEALKSLGPVAVP